MPTRMANSVLHKQFHDLHMLFPSLELLNKESSPLIKGLLECEAQDYDVTLFLSYKIEVSIPSSYPNVLPVAKETGNKISNSFHKNSDNTLCLGTRIDTYKIFCKDKTLLGYFRNLLIPYLFLHEYHCRSGKMRWGQRSHFAKGVIESYQELFQTNNPLVMARLLLWVLRKRVVIYTKCPCGSNINIVDCYHRDAILGLWFIPDEYIESDSKTILNYLQ